MTTDVLPLPGAADTRWKEAHGPRTGCEKTACVRASRSVLAVGPRAMVNASASCSGKRLNTVLCSSAPCSKKPSMSDSVTPASARRSPWSSYGGGGRRCL